MFFKPRLNFLKVFWITNRNEITIEKPKTNTKCTENAKTRPISHRHTHMWTHRITHATNINEYQIQITTRYLNQLLVAKQMQ